ncbi:hypothetical protein CPT03_22035 [Pedobacter ginsengisoli]|uniref:Uncharacterized protein n=1 Tax=Pedobacter ginsengisoli TaxID=363852 RepID=A0A2D1UBF2_9SPHI|nr:hypothetical protein CPT03_22035 [Pedobacter ginsengisoli]
MLRPALFISSYFSDCKYRTNVFKIQNQNINIFFNLLQHKSIGRFKQVPDKHIPPSTLGAHRLHTSSEKGTCFPKQSYLNPYSVLIQSKPRWLLAPLINQKTYNKDFH